MPYTTGDIFFVLLLDYPIRVVYLDVATQENDNMPRVICLANFHRHEPWDAPQEPDHDGSAEDAIEARIDEIWADANLLHYCMDDASIPLSLHTCTMLRDVARRINRHHTAPRTDAELVILAITEDLHGAVVRAAKNDIEAQP